MFSLRTMTAADIPDGMRLKAQNGWNQLEGDWRRLLALEPDGCFVAEAGGQVIGTACGTAFGSVGWVAMVLTDQDHRGRGVGTALTRHVLDYLESRGVRSIRLDATPLGRPIYEKLGFVAEYSLARFEGVLSGGQPAEGVEPMVAEALMEVLELDRRVTGTDRRRALEQLFREWPAAARMVRRRGKVVGFLMARPGSRALYIGPCLANSEAGPLLLSDARQRFAGQTVFVDVPLANSAAIAWAESAGLKMQRHLLRMGRGPTIHEKLDELWASSGPEKG
jgi:GNAT superfamily N-acetyltransferase